MSSNARANARAAALAAAEARLRPPPAYDTSTDDQDSSNTALSPASTSVATTSGDTSVSSNTGLFSKSTTSLNVDSYKPTEKDDRETRMKFSRLLDRGIVRDNGYRQSAEAVETLLKIATNILNNDDPKYRSLKSSNTLLKTKVLSIKGGQDYLVATVDFNQYFVFNNTLKIRHELEIGVEILKEHTKTLQDRLALSNTSATAHAQAESARRAIALREYEADRDQVRARAERERLGREARDRLEREKAEAEAAQQAEAVVDAADEERREMAEAVARPEDEEDEEDEELPSYAEDRASRRWGGAGRRLGA